MYSKIRNTLTAYAITALFVAGGWLLGGPAPAPAQEPLIAALQPALADADAIDIQDADGTHETRQTVVLRAHRANRMNLSMPYFSFVQVLPQRRVN